MKKSILLILLALFISSVSVSCNPENNIEQQELATDPDESTNPQTPPEDDPDNGES